MVPLRLLLLGSILPLALTKLLPYFFLVKEISNNSQALLNEYPQLQCLPVAQPDGGRDAMALVPKSEKAPQTHIVFQIKFVRRPQIETDPHKWLTEILKQEVPKVKKITQEGVDKYYLLTNIPGTAHPSTGSIDKVNKILNDELKIPFQCLWRDDLSRRLDNAWNLKWAYAELMTGQDIIRLIFETGLLEHRDQRISAIKAFVRAQYETDQEVRFKQVELQNKLLDLFIDVPAVRYSQQQGRNERNSSYIMRHIIMQQRAEMISSQQFFKTNSDTIAYDNYIISDDPQSIGAATMLLHFQSQEYFPQIVLEGAPGQGKSTIAQYICQVHRMRILEEKADLTEVPQHFQSSGLRIPFKVDLRDLATWLNKQDPFSSSEESIVSSQDWFKSLEAFLAFQVKTLSGGMEFSVADLHSVAKLSAFLLVLDGLDEVADISKRKDIVAVVQLGVKRLRESCASLQVVVTSRPAAFANSPGFPDSTYPRYELISITKPLINEYVARWCKAKRLNTRDMTDVKRILKEKLDQPHLRDLARSPMQLAILLSLIHARGSSLPDKRTALYDKYVELFFSRESDKSPIVREYRDLLIDIHRYLAWILHSEAEQGRDRGSINSDRLHRLLSEYLSSEGYDPALASKLFAGMVERVVALVSRVQGTYEFEVQPLREYFAARFLYEDAPYSPTGSERKGTKPDRFDAIARNFYWLNVTRFYAGCFSKGELPALVDLLEVLAQSEDYRNTSYPRTLAAMLLSDWVFTQNQRSMREVVKLILDGLGLRAVLIFRNRNQTSNSTLVLPKGCGRDELLGQCFTILRSKPAQDYAREVIEFIKANADTHEIKGLWFKEISDVTGTERTRWLIYGLFLGILSEVNQRDLEDILSDNTDDSVRLGMIFRARHLDFIENSEARIKIIVNSILNRDLVAPYQLRMKSVLGLFFQSFNTAIYTSLDSLGNRIPGNFSLYQASKIIESDLPSENITNTTTTSKTLSKCVQTIEVVKKEQQHTVKEWRHDLTPWDTMIENLRSIWGEQWIIYHLVNIACGINFPKEAYQGFPNLLDHSKSLCKRACYAKSKARVPDWWKRQFGATNSLLERMFVCLIFLTWSSPGTIVSLSEVVDPVFCSLSIDQWKQIIQSVQDVVPKMRKHTHDGLLTLDVTALPEGLSERTLAVLGMRAKQEQAENIYLKYLSNYQGSDSTILQFCQAMVLNLAKNKSDYWPQALMVVARSYTEGIIFDANMFHSLIQDSEINILPIDIAKEITEHPDKYPRPLVIYAEAKCREVVASKVISVGQIAQNDGWFVSE